MSPLAPPVHPSASKWVPPRYPTCSIPVLAATLLSGVATRADLGVPRDAECSQACISHHRQNTSPASGACLSPQIGFSHKMLPSSLGLD